MINSKYIQQAYIDLYVQLRKYIWDIGTVNDIVALELNAYSAFPDIEKLKNQLYKLKTDASSVLAYDEDMQTAFDDFFDLIEDNSDVFLKIDIMQEVAEL